MTKPNSESLNQLLADLHAERVASWRPDDLRINIEQRERLVADENADAYVKVGDVIDSFSVPTPPTSTTRSTPRPVSSRAFLPQSGVVL